MLELLFASVVAVAMPLRAWRRHRLGAAPAPPLRYVLETALLTAALAGLLWRNGVTPAAVGVQPVFTLRFLRDLAICLLAVLGPDVWSAWRVTRSRSRAAAVAAPSGVVADALAGGQALAPFLAVSMAGAIWEELCFRATVVLVVPPTAGGLAAGIVGGSLLFGAQHLRNGRSGMMWASFYGVVFSLLYVATGNLIAVVVAHAAGNVLAAVHWAPRIERARQEAVGRAPIFLG